MEKKEYSQVCEHSKLIGRSWACRLEQVNSEKWADKEGEKGNGKKEWKKTLSLVPVVVSVLDEDV